MQKFSNSKHVDVEPIYSNLFEIDFYDDKLNKIERLSDLVYKFKRESAIINLKFNITTENVLSDVIKCAERISDIEIRLYDKTQKLIDTIKYDNFKYLESNYKLNYTENGIIYLKVILSTYSYSDYKSVFNI